MFESVERIIKGFAKFYFVLGIISGIVLPFVIVNIEDDFMYVAPFIGLGIILSAFIVSCFLYGFGELVENSKLLKNINRSAAPHSDDELPEL